MSEFKTRRQKAAQEFTRFQYKNPARYFVSYQAERGTYRFTTYEGDEKKEGEQPVPFDFILYSIGYKVAGGNSGQEGYSEIFENFNTDRITILSDKNANERYKFVGTWAEVKDRAQEKGLKCHLILMGCFLSGNLCQIELSGNAYFAFSGAQKKADQNDILITFGADTSKKVKVGSGKAAKQIHLPTFEFAPLPAEKNSLIQGCEVFDAYIDERVGRAGVSNESAPPDNDIMGENSNDSDPFPED